MTAFYSDPTEIGPLTDTGPLPAYRAQVASGALQPDPAQALAAERLQDLWRKLRGYDPSLSPIRLGGLLTRLRRSKPVDEIGDHPYGLYLVGAVGRGKSMLMDLFFAAADVPRKRRVHFHAFMQSAHARRHAWMERHPEGDPIPPLAEQIADEAALLCFDEFQIHDIADAILLGRLFEALFARGVVVVATSNTPPSRLFEGRPGRDAFLPFIALMESNLDILVLDAARDYRRARLRGARTWYVPVDARAEAALDAVFAQLTDGAAAHPSQLVVMGRRLTIPLAAEGVARFDFAALCEQPLGPGDYLALATHFHALVLAGIPRLSPANFDVARRFITLIDALYDHRVKLIASAAEEPDLLYEQGENAVMFHRTASRLDEMAGAEWQALAHLP